MSIRDIKTFLAVVETGSFAGAARAVRRTQSSVTVQIRSLENHLGVELFDRSKRPPVLSDAGRRFVDKAQAAADAYDRLFHGNAVAPVEGHLVLGVVPSAITGIMPKALTALRAKYPQLHIQLSMGLSADLVERVRQGGLDAAIVSDLVQGGAGLEWEPFLSEPLVLIAPTYVPTRSAEEIVTSYPFIRYSRQAWVGELIDEFLRKRRLRVSELMVLDTLEAITTMVHHGLGVSVVPQRGAFDPLGLPVRRFTFSGQPTHRTIGLVRLSENPKAALAATLLGELQNLSKDAG
ncbi:LysR family transcriptional regulator [Pseudohoeflea coraliihabitans]|uniref:LysR family transcriptional regulator n=1 Tax=Pseudohoeflea coraliihabitans TaxID=2860393 RepID=A0ABS6WKG3_9HYPH|nr:LysR family transcriptional regulator [Pseudohoeflea sp. DP4N28-3]MBW3096441.1 LysR family transcriptional regulator [Pseudohoeflea sp. DP4N28-3]